VSHIPVISTPLFSLFSRYTRWYVGRSFHAVRISLTGLPPAIEPDRPVVIFLNHASWWDPLMAVVLADFFWKSRRHYAPIDAASLGKYRFFRKLGFYPVEKDSSRGARQFLQTSLQILHQPGAMLWVTPEARFVDPRRRPTELLPGLWHLARKVPHAMFVPVAMEYPFWRERFPEALFRFGSPLFSLSEESLRASLQNCQDALAEEAIAQDAAKFQTLIGGRAGVSLVYDLWRRTRAAVRGTSFSAEHGGPAA
jgi:1-acyl-sn-glycerol-3-phosphate acyltransferase